MHELVCRRVVTETGYCHCDDVGSPVQAYSLREWKALSSKGYLKPRHRKGGHLIGYGKRVFVVDDDARSGAFVIGNVVAKEEQIMGTESVDADEAVLNMLQPYEGLMMDDLIAERPDLRWPELFLAIDRLSRKNLITLHRVGLSYQIFLMNQEWDLGQRQHRIESAAQHQ